jgi:hypothetical protein
MGFIHIDDIRSQHEHLNGSADVLAKNEPNGTSARSFKVAGLIADQVSTPTRMREEIVLLSWLIVLLRTREDGRISYEWVYQNQRDSSNGEVANKLSTEEVLPELQDSVGDSLAAVSRHIESVKGNSTAESSSTSLLLSTGSLLESSDGAKNDVREHLGSIEEFVADHVDYRVCSSSKFQWRMKISKFTQYGALTIFCHIQLPDTLNPWWIPSKSVSPVLKKPSGTVFVPQSMILIQFGAGIMSFLQHTTFACTR